MVYEHAIGYARISSKGQEGNSSIPRQSELIEGWCADTNIPLIGEIQSDEGLSAYDGTNLTEGKLGVIIETARNNGYPPNTLLVVENLDRLSRGDLLESQMLIKKIFDAGLAIKSLSDLEIYSKGNNGLTHVILQLTTFERAHQESKLKSDRVIGSFAERYEEAKSGGKLITPTIPNWLEFNKETGRGVIIEKRKKQIHQIVEFYLENDVGLEKLTTTINSVWKWKPWQHANHVNKSGLWTKSYVGRMLRNPALIGHFQFMVSPVKRTASNSDSSYWKYVDQSQLIDKKWKFGDVIKDYFDPVLDETTYYRLQRKLTKNGTQKKGVSSSGSTRNLFSGFIYCACGGKMHYMGKGKTYAYLVCSSKCGLPTVRYESFEQHVLDAVPLDNSADIKLKNAKIQRENDAILGEIEVAEKYMDDLEAAMEHTKSRRLMNQLAKAENEVEDLKKTIKPLLDLPSDEEQWLLTLVNIEDDQWRSGIKVTLRETIKSITVTSVGKGYHTDIQMKTDRRYWGYFETARKPRSSDKWVFGDYTNKDYNGEYNSKYEGKLKEWVELVTLDFL